MDKSDNPHEEIYCEHPKFSVQNDGEFNYFYYVAAFRYNCFEKWEKWLHPVNLIMDSVQICFRPVKFSSHSEAPSRVSDENCIDLLHFGKYRWLLIYVFHYVLP